MPNIYKYKFELLIFLLILITFHVCYGISIVMPSNINWLLTSDSDFHYLGWAYFQHEPWHFPIGQIENYNYPTGTNIGFTDSIPLVAIFFKFFSFLLPETFQYFGIWLLSCHILAGFFTYKLLKRYTHNVPLLILSLLLVSFCPVLIYRMLHPALCAHWVLIASIYYYTQKANKANVYLINKKQIIVLILSAMINPYLFLMIIGFSLILPFKHYFFDKLISFKRAVTYVIIPIISTLVSWYIIGMVSFGSKDDSMEVENAYGLYGLNLNSLYNSSGFSSVFPQLPSYTVQQYEGYAYLGLGVFILIIISVIFLAFKLFSIQRRAFKNYVWLLPFIVLLVVLTLFSISNKVSLNEQLLFEFGLPDIVLKIGNIFRASGRFVWVLYYTILLGALICFLKLKFSDKIKVILLCLIVGLQFYDIKLFLTSKDYGYGDYKVKPLNEKKWVALTSNFERIVTYPPFENNLVYNLDYQDLCFIALQNKLPITCGYVARNSGTANTEFKAKLELEIKNGIISATDLFIIAPDYLKDFNALIYKNKVEFGFIDGYYYLYSKENDTMDQHRFSELETSKKDSITAELTFRNKLSLIEKPTISTDETQLNIEKNTFYNDILTIEGWAFLKNGTATTKDSIYIILDGATKSYLANSVLIERPDVVGAFKNDNIKMSGFKATIFTETIENSDYNIVVGIKSNNEFTFESINQPVFALDKDILPEKLTNIPYENEAITYNIEENHEELGYVHINGWTFITDQSSMNSTIEIVLENETGASYSIKTFNRKRPDVTAYFKSETNYDDAGFTSKVNKENLKNGTYKIGVLITTESGKKEFRSTDKIVEIKN